MLTDALQTPRCEDVESGTVARVLMHPATLVRLSELQAADFEDEALGAIYAECFRAFSAGKPHTPITLANWLRNQTEDPQRREKVQGYVAGLVASDVAYFDAAQSVKIITGYALRRRLMQQLGGFSRNIVNHQIDEIDIVADMLKKVQEVVAGANDHDTLHNGHVGAQVLQDMRDARKATSTGIFLLDEAMGGGLHAGFTYGICARKKVGKTVMAGTISHNLNVAGVRHGFICGEMGPKQIEQRRLARVMDTSPVKFVGEAAKNEGWRQIVERVIANQPKNIFYRNAPGLTFEKLQQMVVTLLYRDKVEGIILDYLQLVGGKPGSKSTAEHLDGVAQWIADFGRRHGIWMIVVAQINQDGNTRGGEGLRLACDQCYQLHRDNVDVGDAYMEMMDTRYTPWRDIGSAENPALEMKDNGPYFEEKRTA